MKKQENDIKEKVYATFAATAASLGYSEVHGRIIAALLVADKPLALQEISKDTGYSLASISLSLDLLEVIGIVKKFKNPKDRKIYAKLDGDIIEGLRNALLFKIQKEISSTLREFEKHKDDTNQKMIHKLENEIRRLETYVDKLAKVSVPK